MQRVAPQETLLQCISTEIELWDQTFRDNLVKIEGTNAKSNTSRIGAISSGVERHVDIVEVAGSRPASPTSFPGLVTSKSADPHPILRVLA